MKINSVHKSGNFLVLSIGDGDEEHAFIIYTLTLDELNRLADIFAALIVHQNLEAVE